SFRPPPWLHRPGRHPNRLSPQEERDKTYRREGFLLSRPTAFVPPAAPKGRKRPICAESDSQNGSARPPPAGAHAPRKRAAGSLRPPRFPVGKEAYSLPAFL